ncbi:hypothetical protein GF360_00265 [candidate division WWE3 bacterium]|nr:hypothetical protein [candidate division WWE3 bacterium]
MKAVVRVLVVLFAIGVLALGLGFAGYVLFGGDASSDATPPAEPTVVSTPVPVAPPTAVPTVEPTEEFDALVITLSELDPYDAIDLLDADPRKVHVNGPTALDPISGTYVIWTGFYGRIPENVTPLIVDGRTGVWAVTGPADIPSTFGLIALDGAPEIDGEAAIRQVGDATCVPAGVLVSMINDLKGSGELYVALDRLTNSPDYVGAIRRSVEASASDPVTYTEGFALYWLQPGRTFGNTTLILDQFDGEEIQYNFDATEPIRLEYPHGGVVICPTEDGEAPINPARDFPWWGSD